MKIQNILEFVVDVILCYYSLIRKFEVTDNLKSGIADSIMRIYVDYINTFPECCNVTERLIESLTVINHNYTFISTVMIPDITYEIISYFDNSGEVAPNMRVIELNDTPFSGITLTHGMISNVIEFYLNQQM